MGTEYPKSAFFYTLFAFSIAMIAVSLLQCQVLAASSQANGIQLERRDFIGLLPAQSWDASVTATFSGISDYAVFGVIPGASQGFDNNDIPVPPPPPPPYVRAYFYYPGQIPDELRYSRLPPDGSLEWPLRIECAGNTDNITLTWNVENIPSYYSVLQLYRGENLVENNMRAKNNYTFLASSGYYDFNIVCQISQPGVDVSISPSSQSGANGATLNYTVTVNNTGNVSDTYSLTTIDNAGWSPSVSPTSLTVSAGSSGNATLSVKISSNAIGGTIDNIKVTATGTGDNSSANCTAELTIARSVSVSITPPSENGANGQTLIYTVTVSNTGNVDDTYTLENTDTVSWIKGLSNTSVAVPAFSSDNTTTLSVTIPSFAIGGTIDNIKVTATGTGGSGSANCTAQVTITRGVSVLISPPSQNGSNGETLTYTVTITNTGNVSDTYKLENTDNAGWVKSLSTASLTIPDKSSDVATLSVTIPNNAQNGDWDNITVKATSKTDSTITDNDSCAAHVIQEVFVQILITPENQSGAPGSTLTYTVEVTNGGNGQDNFDLSVSGGAGWNPQISPSSLALAAGASGTAILSVTVPDNASGGSSVGVAVTATSKANPTVSASANCVARAAVVRGVRLLITPPSKSGSNGETLTYTVTVSNTGNIKDNYILTDNDNAGWSPSVSKTSIVVEPFLSDSTTTLSVVIPSGAENGTIDNIWVKATSKDNAAIFDNKSCTAQVIQVGPPGPVPSYGVDVSISPSSQSGSNGTTLKYIVTVSNTGNVSDTYTLENTDNAGWAKSLSTASLTVPGKSSDVVTLSVTIPSNAQDGAWDNITVKATSRTNSSITDKDSCAAHVIKGVVGVQISITPENQSGAPGATLSYTVKVTNGSNVQDNFDLSVSGGAGWNPQISPSSLTLAAGASGNSTLSVTVPGEASGGSSVGIAVTATSRLNPTMSASASCIARAAVVRGVRLSISPSEGSGSPGATLKYTVTVTNTGNVVDNYDLAVTDNTGWNLKLSSSILTISIKGLEKIVLDVTIPGNARLGTSDSITITARSRADPTKSDSASCRAIATGPSAISLAVPLIAIVIIIILTGGYLLLKFMGKGGRRRRVLSAHTLYSLKEAKIED